MKFKYLTIAAFIVPASLQAATIGTAGTITDTTPPGFGSGTDVANFDSAGVGTDGFVLFNSVVEGTNISNRPWNENIVDSKPAYITSLDGSASATSSGGWANYDDITVGGTNYNTGGLAGPANVETALMTFQLGAGVPTDFTIGVIANNSDSAAWGTTNIRIEGPGAVTASQAVAINGGTDLVQFDINGGVAGETYTVHVTGSTSGALIGGLAFDSIPEPSSIGLFLLGGLAGLGRRRR